MVIDLLTTLLAIKQSMHQMDENSWSEMNQMQALYNKAWKSMQVEYSIPQKKWLAFEKENDQIIVEERNREPKNQLKKYINQQFLEYLETSSIADIFNTKK